MSPEEIPTRDLIPGVIVAAVVWQILQHIGGYYVEHVVRHAQETSGLFAFVLGSTRMAVSRRSGHAYRGGDQRRAGTATVAAQLLLGPLLDADKRALTSSAETEERVEEENVEVSFDEPE